MKAAWCSLRARHHDGSDDPPGGAVAWHDLDPGDRRRIRARVDDGLHHDDPDTRAFAWKVAEAIAAWTMDVEPASEHLRLEITAVQHRGGDPLPPGAPVPGCACATCTGVPADDPSRVPAWRRRDPEGTARSDRERRARWERTVEAARALTVEEVARRLGLGDPVKRGRELAVRCPLHDDSDPSLRIAPDGRTWYCDPCAEGGDAIALYMAARRLDFAEAVRELTR